MSMPVLSCVVGNLKGFACACWWFWTCVCVCVGYISCFACMNACVFTYRGSEGDERQKRDG